MYCILYVFMYNIIVHAHVRTTRSSIIGYTIRFGLASELLEIYINLIDVFWSRFEYYVLACVHIIPIYYNIHALI